MVFLFTTLLFAICAGAQLTGHVGPLTPASAKANTKTCSVLDHGGVADGKTDVGPAITSAFNDCKAGGVVVIPSGNFALGSWVGLGFSSYHVLYCGC